jgi:ATP-dependent helicase/nuclease subunit A
MQYICFENCTEEAGIRGEIDGLVQSGFLTPEQAATVDSEKLHRFFSSEIGVKLRSGIAYLREFKFSILVDGSQYDSALKEEKILLQGVVDCALLEDDGITVIDFKTDYVTEENLQQVISRYRGQVETYADALQRIYEQPVKARYLYLFHLDRLISL